MVEWALNPAFLEGRNELAFQAELGPALPAEDLDWSRIVGFVFTEAIPFACKVYLQRTKALGTVLRPVEEASLALIEVRVYLDFRVISLKRKGYIFVMKNVEGELVGVAELILGGVENLR